MEQLAADLLPVARMAVLTMFAVLAIAAIAQAPRAGATGCWVAAAFGSLALALLGVWLPEAVGVRVPPWLDAVALAAILVFPYLLMRFTASFRDLPRWLEAVAAVIAVAVVVSTLVLLPLSREAGAPGAAWFSLYVIGVLAYWVALSLVTVQRLWRAGRGQPTVARRRMRLMSAATAVLAVALLMTAQPGDGSSVLSLAGHVVALASAMIFGLGFRPPRALRLSWRQAEEEHLRQGLIAVLSADTVEQVAAELLSPTARVVGGGAAAIVDSAGRVVASSGHGPEVGTRVSDAGGASANGRAREVVPLGVGRGELVVWTNSYTPFFGNEEVDLLRGMGAVASLALERCELRDDERAQRAAMELAQREAERAREEATRANTAKTEFLSRMSHELRTPLNAILGFGQLLETAELGSDDQEGVQHILKAGRHLLALINDVLDLSRVEAGTLTISPEPVHAGELVQDTLTLIRPLADSRSIRLTASLEGCDAYIRTDRQRARQILLNLLSNAVKYNHDGGEVSLRCSVVSDKMLRVAVRDTGPGIDPARRARLFQPFERLGAEASSVEGTGLGLALTQQLAERLGGSIGVETAPGQGSTFWVDLPVTEAPPESETPASSRRAPAATGERTLLLVEDNLANLRVVEAMLRRRPGLTVLPAMQGGIAIELAREHKPDMIVLDLHLPDLSGREVLYRLKADPGTRDIPVVIASADATPGRVRQLQEAGAFDYLTKPLDLQQFLDVVDAALAPAAGARG